jgi:hypothetical protein
VIFTEFTLKNAKNPKRNRQGRKGKIKFGPAMYRRSVCRTICGDRLPLSSFYLPHAYFYGNWGPKVPNILHG